MLINFQVAQKITDYIFVCNCVKNKQQPNAKKEVPIHRISHFLVWINKKGAKVDIYQTFFSFFHIFFSLQFPITQFTLQTKSQRF